MAPSGTRRRVSYPVSDFMSCIRRAKEHGTENLLVSECAKWRGVRRLGDVASSNSARSLGLGQEGIECFCQTTGAGIATAQRETAPRASARQARPRRSWPRDAFGDPPSATHAGLTILGPEYDRLPVGSSLQMRVLG